MDDKFYKGETVICVLNNRASLTVGKEYMILGIESYSGDDNSIWLSVMCDRGYTVSYHHTRFLPKSDFRILKINSLLK